MSVPRGRRVYPQWANGAGLTFGGQVGLRGVTAAAVAGGAAVQAAVLLLGALNGQHAVVQTQDHA